MGKVVETIKAVNSAVRTILALIVVGAMGTFGFLGYQKYTEAERRAVKTEQELLTAQQDLGKVRLDLTNSKAKIGELEQDVAQKQVQIERLETSLQLLKVDQRLARLEVVKIVNDEATQKPKTTVRFVELNPSGSPLSQPKEFTIDGDVIYVDNWIVKFEDQFVEKADIERGTSLCLFRRIFGEHQSPNEGFSLDEVGMRPQAYARGGAVSEFEQKIWGDFWEFANNPDKAAQMGIRAANGEAVSIKAKEGMSYSITLRSSGGLSIEPVTTEAAAPKEPGPGL